MGCELVISWCFGSVTGDRICFGKHNKQFLSLNLGMHGLVPQSTCLVVQTHNWMKHLFFYGVTNFINGRITDGTKLTKKKKKTFTIKLVEVWKYCDASSVEQPSNRPYETHSIDFKPKKRNSVTTHQKQKEIFLLLIFLVVIYFTLWLRYSFLFD